MAGLRIVTGFATLFVTEMLIAAEMTAAPRWLVAWAVAMSMTWLLPNHYPPWTTFQSDAWAVLLLLARQALISFSTEL